MTTACIHLGAPYMLSRNVEVPGQGAGNAFGYMMQTLSVQRLSSEPVGTHTLTLTNVAVGSRVTIRDQANTTEFHNALAASSTVPITLQVYPSESPLNNLSIRVRKSSAAPKYLPFETIATIGVGSSSIYVSQVPDTIAS